MAKNDNNKMTTVEDLKEYVKKQLAKRNNDPDFKPVYEIILFEHPDKKEYYEKNGERTGFWFPDLGERFQPGFYYDIDAAVKTMHKNAWDIHAPFLKAGFVISRFPGMFQTMGREGRIYFLWDEEKKGYFEAEEPDTFALFGY